MAQRLRRGVGEVPAGREVVVGLRKLHRARPDVAVHLPLRAETSREQPLERVGSLGPVEVGGGSEVGEALADLGHDVGRLELVRRLVGGGVGHRGEVDRLSPHVVVEVAADDARAEGDEHDRVDDLDVALRPLQDVGHVAQRVLVHGRVERTAHPSSRGHHLGVALAQLAQLDLVRLLPARAALLGVDVKREAGHAGALELLQELLGERQAVGVDDRLQAIARDHPDDLDDLRMHERVAARDRHAVHGAKALEHVEVVAHLIEGLVSPRVVLPVAAQARQVALLGRLQPGDRVVRQRPRQAIELAMIDGGGHVSHIDTFPGWSAIGHIGLGDAVEER